MTDIYDMLIGAPPSTEEQLRATADQLRKRKLTGQLGVLTGDPIISQVGKGLTSDVGDQITQLQKARQSDAQRGMMQGYYDAQQENWKNNLAFDRTRHEDQMALDWYKAMNPKDSGGSGGKPPRLRLGDIKTIRENASALGTISEMKNYVDTAEESPGQMTIGGVAVPGARTFTNWAASKGIGTEGSKNAAMFWQNFRRFYELAERNAMFGATLTTNEMRAWKAANPNEEQTAQQLKDGLEVMQKVYQQNLDNFTSGLEYEGYSPEAISAYSKTPEFNPVPSAVTPENGAGPVDRGESRAGKVYVQGKGWQ